jgi:putative flavoprotein involved in K+ transport
VVWATGYRLDHSWIDVPGVRRDGRVLHTRGITEVPGLYFLGLPWQHTRGSALLGFVADDAAHVAAHVARTAAVIASGQLPGPRGAQSAPPHVRK